MTPLSSDPSSIPQAYFRTWFPSKFSNNSALVELISPDII